MIPLSQFRKCVKNRNFSMQSFARVKLDIFHFFWILGMYRTYIFSNLTFGCIEINGGGFIDPSCLLGVMCRNAQVDLGVLEIIQHRIVSVFGSRLCRKPEFFHERRSIELHWSSKYRERKTGISITKFSNKSEGCEVEKFKINKRKSPITSVFGLQEENYRKSTPLLSFRQRFVFTWLQPSGAIVIDMF